jgi:1-deoxy-D-xylulose-5-phosphate reductoisomerase
MVEYVDCSVLAQLGTPDMRTPIAFAMGWPNRLPAPSERLDFGSLGALTFETPDLDRFPALRLALDALRAGGAAPTVLNAANEIAVQAFLGGKIGFLDIAATVERTLEAIDAPAIACLDDVAATDTAARHKADELVAQIATTV